MSLPSGRRVAIDFGTTRCGIATTDPAGLLASPYLTLPVAEISRTLSQLASETPISIIYIGLPLHLGGSEGASAKLVRQFASEIAQLHIAEVRLVDERLSSKSAAQDHDAVARYGVDAVAAREILDLALNEERSQGRFAGKAIHE